MKTALCCVAALCLLQVSLLSQGRAFFGAPPDDHNPWAVHDRNRPAPPVVDPGDKPGGPPSDAIVLFDGTQASFEKWHHEKPEDERESNWVVSNGALMPQKGAGSLLSKEVFGDCQLHLEWAAPEEASGKGQGRGNSGVFLMGMVEVQILDNYNNPSYADGMAGAIYAVMPPAVNALKPPGEWQSYDIIFRRPVVRDGVVLDPGFFTVLVNGVVVQDSTPINGGGAYRKRMPLDRAFPEAGPLELQDHGDPVRFRNIWVRPLRPRELDGGTDGRLSKENTMRKREAIADTVLDQASGESGLPRALLLMESLIYKFDKLVLSDAERLISEYLGEWPTLTAAEQQAEERAIKELHRALKYLETHGFVAPEYRLGQEVEAIARQNDWIR
ncbi:MAG: DUF1080 domain-containing protein [Verrucomicrobia bacterium]|jgi:hypothetical protein|nr:DUF1080 domain-containing protein [Verrucomicrobiota bacterium]